MPFPNQRLAQLFAMLQNETLPQDELAQRLSVSTRTIRADITVFNALLMQHGAQCILHRGKGYQLRIDDTACFQSLQALPPDVRRIPRTVDERTHALVVRFLTSAFSLKLEDLADEWFVSRATLQNDMADVRERLQRYNLTLAARPRHGMKLFGSEMAIRSCLTDLLYERAQQGRLTPAVTEMALDTTISKQLTTILYETLHRHRIRFTDEGELFLRLYCVVSVRRITEGYLLPQFSAEGIREDVRGAARDMAIAIAHLAGRELSPSEENWLCVHIAARQIQESVSDAINADDDEALVSHILDYINTHYNYSLIDDAQLYADLLTHIKTMLTRVRYQIMIPNPLLDNIRQHYPMAWDMTLAAMTNWGKYTSCIVSENEIGFLVLLIGVGLERHYNTGCQQRPGVLLVCDAGNALVRMIEAVLYRNYPQIKAIRVVTLREYEQSETISEDFVISTAHISKKSKPVVMITPFPTHYQLEQIGRLVLVDRTHPRLLDKYFDAAHFRIIGKSVSQQTLLRELCEQLCHEGFVDEAFCDSVVEREAIVSTMLGDGIALPHSLGLLARKTVVYTVLAPQGIQWGDETAYVIFLLAISKREYEEAMIIYDLFVTFLRERATARLCACADFTEFRTVAMECLSRFRV